MPFCTWVLFPLQAWSKSKTRNYFKIKCTDNIKVYIFVMWNSEGIIWHVIHENRSLLKIWPLFDPGVTPTGKGSIQPIICHIFYDQYIVTLKISMTQFCKNCTWIVFPLKPSIPSYSFISFAKIKGHLLSSYRFLMGKKPRKDKIRFQTKNDVIARPVGTVLKRSNRE